MSSNVSGRDLNSISTLLDHLELVHPRRRAQRHQVALARLGGEAGAVVIGAYVEAGLVMVLFAIGEALDANGKVVEVKDASHVVMVSHPDKVAALIVEAAR